ncbi:C39 family peptidase [Plantactinospora sp. KLBMP9567]|uniref:C39 family peptidase n=1 Tax=Plantactinospora sp. KLBMP9567 TaxID=3085900 RepID=UPI00298274F9|nr:C39 family peptidase [Plantactinospora sp. KLBMP9567]MDW5329342.1 C39 family peptidase [Plantactinospora sp. KLBMP9567]
MKHAINGRFRTAMSGRRNRLALASAAVLAAAASSGVVLASTGSAEAPETSTVAVAELGAPAGQAGAAIVTAPETTAPETTAPATPSQSTTTAPTTKAAKAAPASTPSKPPAPPESKLLDYEFQAQINGWYCGPAATRIALTVRDKQPSQDAVAADLGTTMSGTNSAEDTTRVLNKITGTDFYRTTAIPGGAATPAQMDRLQADVVHAVTSGYAVVVNIAGSATDLDGGWHSYPGGHYLTVVGYRDDGRTVKIADPAIPGEDSNYWMTTIDLANWAATRGYSS